MMLIACFIASGWLLVSAVRDMRDAEWMKQQTGLEPHDICVNVRKTLAPTMAQGVPHFFQNGVSYWLIYAWRSKAPFRPVRFDGA